MERDDTPLCRRHTRHTDSGISISRLEKAFTTRSANNHTDRSAGVSDLSNAAGNVDGKTVAETYHCYGSFDGRHDYLIVVAVSPLRRSAGSGSLLPWAVIGLGIIYLQIILGGWTSANYAALICADFPVCQGQWWPAINFVDGFTLWRGAGIDYGGSVGC